VIELLTNVVRRAFEHPRMTTVCRPNGDPSRSAVTAEIAATRPGWVVILIGAVWIVVVALAQSALRRLTGRRGQ
jgi:hypothetical protein